MPIDPRIALGGQRESVPLLTPGDAQAQQQKQQMLAQESQMRAAQLEKQRADAGNAQSAQQARQVLQGAMSRGIKNGKVDIDAISLELANAGLADAIPKIKQSFYDGETAAEEWKSARLKADEAERKAMAALASAAEASGDQAAGVLLAGIAHHVDRKLATEDDVLPIITQLQNDPSSAATIIAQMKAAAGMTAKEKTEAGFTLSPGQTRYDAQGNPIANAPVPDKPAGQEQGFTLTPGGKRFDASGKMIAEVPERPDRGSRATAPVAVMGPDGKPIFVRPDQAYGRQPANSREQGRAVTSGDANRLADYDSSLNDLKTLKLTISGSQVTGTAAKIGASIPNWVTDITGVGAESKSKQAVIDRVKQVIGKALEGGVLRKEDESKYEKILPTIGDTQSVVATKLAGLEAAITQRRQTQLDNLEDAGYDVSKYRTRTTAPVQPKFRYNPATGKTEPIGGQ